MPYKSPPTSLMSLLWGNQSARDIKEVCSVTMEMWYYYIISIMCDVMEQHKVNTAMMGFMI